MEATPQTAASVRQTCSECAGNLVWDAAAEGLRCDRCDSVFPATPAAEADDVIAEHDLEAALAGKARWQLGAAARQARCDECGAVVEFPEGLVATRCSFCDSPSVLAQEARRDLLAPESLVPFRFGKEQANAAFRAWLGKLWFRPSDLKQRATVTELRGVYVPYWTFDAEVTSRWTADAGYYYYVTERYTTQENGRSVTKTRQVRKIRWRPASGTRHDRHDDHLVCASRGLPEDLGARVSAHFETAALVPYAPTYLQGFLAESYAVTLPDAWARGEEEIAAIQRRRCAGDVPGDTHRFLRTSHRFTRTTCKHVLLPVWIAAFRYRDKVYRFLVNGQTGAVAGMAPWSVWKILLLVVVLAAVAVGLLALRGAR